MSIPPGLVRRPPPFALVTLCAVVLLGAAACSPSGDRSSSATTAAPPSTSSTSVSAGPATPAASPGCAAPPGGAPNSGPVTEERRTVDVAGTARSYLLTTPSVPDRTTPVPLVLDLHGYSEGATVHSRMTGYSALAQQERFVVAFPDGLGSPPQWNVNIKDPTNADLAFVDALMARLGNDLCIDTARVYATGLSMGAWFSSALACTRADKIAAIAPVAGIQYQEGCRPARAVPVVAFHGTADPILYFNGGIGDLRSLMSGATTADAVTVPPADVNGAGYPANVRAWAKRNGCGPTPEDTKVTAQITRRVYPCPKGADVEFYVIDGGGHSWPGSAFSRSIAKIIGPTNMDLDATRVSWNFLKRFRLPTR